MAVRETTSCRRHRHPEFRITYDPALVPVEDDLRWFVDWLEQAVADGERFADGQTCQIGWGITEVRTTEDGFLTLWEPDMAQMPIAWVESVSRTLAQLRLQKDVCESMLTAGDLSFPSMRQSAIICTWLGRTEGVVLERREPTGSDSGWFCGCSDEQHDHNSVSELRKVSLYEAAVRYAPQIVPYLALPEGVLLETDQGAPTIFRHGEPLTFKAGSYLAILHQGR